jgi:hypothetical protein
MKKKLPNGPPALVNLSGEIRAADLDHGTFILRLSDGTRLLFDHAEAEDNPCFDGRPAFRTSGVQCARAG